MDRVVNTDYVSGELEPVDKDITEPQAVVNESKQ
jgi:hypothetical protein